MTDTSLRVPDRGWWEPLLVPTPLRHGAPNAAPVLSAMDAAVTRGYNAMLATWDRRYIDTATGDALDEFGKRIKAPRVSSEVGEDDAYRRRLKALLSHGLASTGKADIQAFCEATYGVPTSVSDGPSFPPTLVVTFLGWNRQMQDSPLTLNRIKAAGVLLSVRAIVPTNSPPNLVNDFSLNEVALGGDSNVVVIV